MNLLFNDKIFSTLNRIRKITLNIILDIIFIVLFCVAILMVVNLISLKMGNSKYPLFGAYVIVSQSMVPTINVDDAVVIKRTDPSKLKKGDIITFSSSDARYFGYTITHRISDVENDYSGNFVFRTKGDNNNSIDNAPVLSDNILGKVIFIIPYLGKIQKFLMKPYGWFLLVIVPIVLFGLYDVISIYRKRRISKISI